METPVTDFWKPFSIIKPVGHEKNSSYKYTFCSSNDQQNWRGLQHRRGLQHQQINSTKILDGFYHCFNRVDENPFDKRSTTENGTKHSSGEKWLNDVNTPCPEGKNFRRCLGYATDTCVSAMGTINKLLCKYFIFKGPPNLHPP